MRIPRTEVRCEVLIIGGGLAALVAALEAKKLVDEVVIVSKSKLGRLLELENYGVRFRKTNDDFLRESSPGHSCPRTISTRSDYPHAVLGLSITLSLLREARSRGGG